MAHHDNQHHHISVQTHYAVFAALIGFTVLTVVTAKLMDFGAFNSLIAFSIATFKGFLVMAYFMHLKFDEKIFRWIIASSFFFVMLLFVFLVLDLSTRNVQESTILPIEQLYPISGKNHGDAHSKPADSGTHTEQVEPQPAAH
ncbi:MAG: cytochrome C oxidase subunit IV family protein [Bdellovibrionaceae bacterium]|nr:cytochrome C oxidase subunit IV family protein [Pseudobdellovibrionaceae bacterium]